jgi:hypothetical protein
MRHRDVIVPMHLECPRDWVSHYRRLKSYSRILRGNVKSTVDAPLKWACKFSVDARHFKHLLDDIVADGHALPRRQWIWC